MESNLLSREDLHQLRTLGMEVQQVISHLEAFKRSAPFVRLERPCTLGDGIRTLHEGELDALALLHRGAARQGRCVKFVPASGAATRMFKLLLQFQNQPASLDRKRLRTPARGGDGASGEFVAFLDSIERFAFFDDLQAVALRNGEDVRALLTQGRFSKIHEYLLDPQGLNYAELPKGLLKFHRYPEGNRTSFEEHLVEATEYVRDAEGNCRIHFTISQEHREGFEALFQGVRERYERQYGVRFLVTFSVQRRSTDTIAVDMENRPFRLADGKLLFRPAGHGALIENLNALEGDIVFIKNIDNVVPDRIKGLTFLWKKALAGYLIQTQERIFSCLRTLDQGDPGEGFIEEAMAFAKTVLSVSPPQGFWGGSPRERKAFLMEKLHRPLRVCGVVRNQGEPGGGPFWIKEADGTDSLQIVESVQVDPESETQQKIWASATHFNPVDIVCGVRDHRGKIFDLKRYVDPHAVLIARKSQDGRELKALELPGLWNGAMAHWNTVFIEVPLITFNPVKTINDLLRQEHQPG